MEDLAREILGERGFGPVEEALVLGREGSAPSRRLWS
jgi:hypothetical protein